MLNSLQRNFTFSVTFNVLSLAGSDNLLTHTHTHTLGTLVAFSYARVRRSVPPLPKDVSNIFGIPFYFTCCADKFNCDATGIFYLFIY